MPSSHIAHARDLRSKLDRVAEILRKRDYSVTVDTFEDPTAAITLMGVTFEGTSKAARGLCIAVERWASTLGISLRGSVTSRLPDDLRATDLRPGERRVGFVAVFPRSKAA